MYANLRRLVDEHQVGGLVVGYPYSMDGREGKTSLHCVHALALNFFLAGKACQYVRRFCEELGQGVELPPLVLWDERLSTAVVTRALKESSNRRIKKHKEKGLDMMCAAYILQSALNRLKTL